MIKKLYSLSFLFGCIYAFGFPIFGTKISFLSAPILAFAGFFYLLILADTKSHVFVFCTLFSLGFYSVGFYWLPHTITEFGQIPFPINHIIGLHSIFVLTPHIFIFGILHYFLRKKIPSNDLGNFLFSILFISLQYSIPQLFSAYPGHSWIKLAPYLFPATIFGEYIFSFVSILLSFEICFILRKKRVNHFNLGLVLILIASCFIPINTTNLEKTRIKVRIAQANIGNNAKLSAEKGLPNSVDSVLATYKNVSLTPPASDTDLIVWPETAFPYSISPKTLTSPSNLLPQVFQEIMRVSKSDVFFGGYLLDTNANNNQTFNSAFFVEREGAMSVYNKNKLLPFGESLPFTKSINSAIYQLVPGISFFSESNKTTLFNSITKKGKPYSFLGFICYEALAPTLLRKHINSLSSVPNFLINLTNDSWYGNTSEPEQHLFLSRWRSVEFGLPMIRSANTGISSFISSRGLELKRSSIDKIMNLEYEMKYNPSTQKTIYLIWGSTPFICLIFGISSILLFLQRKTFFK